MNNTAEINNTRTLEPVSFASSKDAVKNIYAAMVGFIEAFRIQNSAECGEKDATSLSAYFRSLYLMLMLSRLDIPQKTYKALCSFAENYLQQMAVMVDYMAEIEEWNNAASGEEYVLNFDDEEAPWWSALYAPMAPDSDDYLSFRSKMEKQYDIIIAAYHRVPPDTLTFEFCLGDVIVSAAYDRLSAILADYMEV